MDETVSKEVLLFYSFVVESLTESVLERVKKIDKKLDELKTFLEDVFLTPEESVLLKDADRLVKGKRFKELTALDDVYGFPSQKSRRISGRHGRKRAHARSADCEGLAFRSVLEDTSIEPFSQEL